MTDIDILFTTVRCNDKIRWKLVDENGKGLILDIFITVFTIDNSAHTFCTVSHTHITPALPPIYNIDNSHPSSQQRLL